MTIEPDKFYSPRAPELRVIAAVQTLARWRHERQGPPFHRSGNSIIYLGQDILDWLEARRVEPGTKRDVA